MNIINLQDLKIDDIHDIDGSDVFPGVNSLSFFSFQEPGNVHPKQLSTAETWPPSVLPPPWSIASPDSSQRAAT